MREERPFHIVAGAVPYDPRKKATLDRNSNRLSEVNILQGHIEVLWEAPAAEFRSARSAGDRVHFRRDAGARVQLEDHFFAQHSETRLPGQGCGLERLPPR